MPFPLTEEQQKIVDDRGGQLLVSAAAGSGKTRVLVERLMDRVTREGEDIDRFLVITYTKAAAAELRGRIAQELSARLAQTPGDRRLRRQSTLIYQAPISTIHSFCADLLRENSHLLELDPDFRLCDEGEGLAIQAQVLEEVLERQYVDMAPDGPFARLVDTLSAGRDDSRLAAIVLDIFGRIQSHPKPEQWLEEQRALWRRLDSIVGAEDTPWGALLLEQVRRQAEASAGQLKQALELSRQDELLAQNYAPGLEQTAAETEELIWAAGRGWDAARGLLPVSFPKAGAKRKRHQPADEARAAAVTEQVKALRTTAKKRLDGLCALLDGDSGEKLDELKQVRPAVLALLELVGEFSRAYAGEKARRGVLDFSDLEHLSVRLLWDGHGATDLARRCAQRYAEVMVDEYQDTNQVQNVIFNAISDDGRKLFQVGDVKQSIYRFRLADPTIFLEKYRRFADGDQAEEGQPRRRVLSRNFRSQPPVLEGCNDLFRNIMSTELGELDYTDDQALVPGLPGDGRQEPVELDVVDLSCLGEMAQEDREDKDLLEARLAARRIRQMLDAPMLVGQGEEARPLTPSDVMLLLRSPGKVLPQYIRALEEQGIPWSAEVGDDFFQSTEVSVALSLLEVVDNPRQDVALIAALRSPVYGFTGDQLALIRAGHSGDFYSAVTTAAREGDEPCRRFLEELEQLRFGMGDRTCRQLIWHIYQRTNLLGLFSAMDPSGRRRDHLLALYALAGQLEDAGCTTLFQFLLRLQRMRESGKDLKLPAAGRGGEGVSILSIHRSKGLEKPVVLVCGLYRLFNTSDFNRPVLFHPEYGVGPRGLDEGRMVEYPTLARQGVALQLRRELLAEELRLLYVAMTRARDKLILTMGLPRGRKTVESLRDSLSLPMDPVVLGEALCPGQWVLLHALTRPEGAALRDGIALPEVAASGLGTSWDIRWEDGASLQEAGAADAPGNGGEDREEEPVSLSALAWQYPHGGAVDMPSKLTATQLRRDGAMPVREEEPENKAPGRRQGVRPRFVTQQTGLTPAQRGTALHMAMQYLPVHGAHDEGTIRAELERLVSGGFLTPEQGEAVKPEKLAAFYRSPLGKAVERAGMCRQEFKFSVLVPAEDYRPGTEGEQVLLQGVIDCWFQDEQGITVLDFKSDHLSPGQEKSRGEEYRPQLEAYARALSAILDRPVSRKVLWFFATDTAVEL